MLTICPESVDSASSVFYCFSRDAAWNLKTSLPQSNPLLPSWSQSPSPIVMSSACTYLAENQINLKTSIRALTWDVEPFIRPLSEIVVNHLPPFIISSPQQNVPITLEHFDLAKKRLKLWSISAEITVSSHLWTPPRTHSYELLPALSLVRPHPPWVFHLKTEEKLIRSHFSCPLSLPRSSLCAT